MKHEPKVICDQLAQDAGFDKDEFLFEQERVITQDELEALAAAYADKVEFHNWQFNAEIKKPGHPRCLRKVWNKTIAKYWGLELQRRFRNGEPVYMIHAGVK